MPVIIDDRFEDEIVRMHCPLVVIRNGSCRMQMKCTWKHNSEVAKVE